MLTKDIFMLCSSCQDEAELKAFDKSRWKANEKYDGCRVIAVKKGLDIILFNRLGHIVTHKFREVVEALSLIPTDFMIDGEIISFDNDFNKLQSRALTKNLVKIAELEKTIPVKYMVFDILANGEEILMKKPLQERLAVLRNLLPSCESRHIEIVEFGEIDDMLALAIKNDGEGIVIKDMLGWYESKRSKLWFKHKLFKETTLTITNYTENPKGIRATANDGTAVQISGHNQHEIKHKLGQDGYVVINVQYLSKGTDGKMRFPSYRGIAN